MTTTTETKTQRRGSTGTKSTRAKKAAPAPPVVETKPPARIRMPNELVELIISTPPENPTLDLLQAHLLHANAGKTAQDKIVVTYDAATVELTRDWCVRLIANSGRDEKGKAVASAASKVIGFIDSYEGRTAD